MYFREPRISVLARPAFVEPEHLRVHWLGESSDGERLAEFAGRLCYMSQRNPANRTTAFWMSTPGDRGAAETVIFYASCGETLRDCNLRDAEGANQ